MGPHYLDRLFNPRAVAVLGASDRPNSVGMRVFHNLITGGFKGEILAVNPKHPEVQGRPSHATIRDAGKPVDLAVIATPARTVPDIIYQCGEHGVRAAVVLSAGFAEAGADGAKLQQAMLETAQRYGMRLVGPNCLGLMRPRLGLNATFSKGIGLPGDLALVSQSGAICTAILDWAEPHQVGFSSVISLGDAADVDFGDVLDYLALDPQTRGILLYVEGTQHTRGFISALRAAARLKPVVVVKAGRQAEGSRAAISHTAALIGADDVFDAVLERAGAVRANSIDDLFSAAQILSSGVRVEGRRLAIVTNAGGPGVMATDRAVELGLQVPALQDATLQALDRVLPAHWSKNNPVDILGDAPPQRYQESVSICLKDTSVDGVMVILTPQAMTEPTEAARAVEKVARKSPKPVLACWMGERQVAEAWSLFSSKKVPGFRTPEATVEAFHYLAAYHRNQKLLLQVPGPLSYHDQPDVEGARLIIDGVLSERRKVLTPLESKAVLAAFHVPVVQTIQAHTANEALVAAESLGFPVAMKVSSADITHKSDVGGVRLNIRNAQAVRSTFNDLMSESQRAFPGARINGITVERMHDTSHGRELLVGVSRDPAFGPVISFGAGGTMVEVLRDRAVALPPLNRFIVRGLIGRTRAARLLAQFRNLPAARLEAVENVLLRVSEMVCELPQLVEMDINPLIADERGAVAVDARIVVDYYAPSPDRYAHMAIYPYPAHLVTRWQLADGTDITVRPIRPEDAEIEQAFVRGLSAESRYMRFMQTLQELSPTMLVRLTQIDYDREMALIATVEREGEEVELGVARYAINPDGRSCEFAIVIADAWRRKGIGSRLMTQLMEAAKARGIKTMEGEILANNAQMLSLCRTLGFTVHTSPEDVNVKVVHRTL
jgi:acetyltransferase